MIYIYIYIFVYFKLFYTSSSNINLKYFETIKI